MLAIYGTIDHVSNYVLQIAIFYNDQMYNDYTANVKALMSQHSPSISMNWTHQITTIL
jgi:hypothetical protein